VILTDTGPLVALIDRRDANHALCVEAVRRLPAEPLVTTWPCFTEAMYLLRRAGGHPAQIALWKLLRDRRLVMHDLAPDDVKRMEMLMYQYRDKPMDLADASIVATAEALATQRLLSLDSDFRIYRLSNGSTLDIVS
jgi:uncharacterized protein